MGEILNFLPLFPAFSPSLFPAGPKRGAICFNSFAHPSWFSEERTRLHCRSRRRCGFDPWVGKSPRGGNGHALQYSCLKNSMDRGAWRVTVQRVTKSQTRRSARAPYTHTHTHTHTHARTLRESWPKGRSSLECTGQVRHILRGPATLARLAALRGSRASGEITRGVVARRL